MKNVNVSMISILLSASIGASAAIAQAPPETAKVYRAQKMHERMKAADKDGDGNISRAEAVALPRLAKHFDEIDSNKDGIITKDEIKAYREKKGAHKHKQG